MTGPLFIIPERQQLHVSPIQERAEMNARDCERFDNKYLFAIQAVLIVGIFAAFLTGMAHIGFEHHSAWVVDNQEILTLRGSL